MSFPRSPISTHASFELIHCDISGGYQTESISGAKYFLTNVDDYSRATWVYLMSHKSETRSLIQAFVELIQNQFDQKVKQIRFDNGEEFHMKLFFSRKWNFSSN